MKLFKLEEYLTKYEFNSPYPLCCSDVENWSVADILALATIEQKQQWQKLSLAYTEPFGAPSLRKQIAKSIYPTLTADNLLCFAGAEEAIYACLNVLCDSKSHAIVVCPCYQSLYEIPAQNCQSVTMIELEEASLWQLDVNQIEAAIQANTNCIVINFPHNPTGQVLCQETLDRLIALCHKHDIWLYSDEVYRLIGTWDQAWPDPIATQYTKGVSLGVMSKAYGMPGLRIGWVACQDKNTLLKFKQYKDYLSICNSSPSEFLAEIALANQTVIIEKNNQIIKENHCLLEAFLKKHSELFSWIPSLGGCIGLIKYHGHQSIDELCHQLVNEEGVLLMPGSVYNLEGNYFRIGFGRKNFPMALEKFEKFMEQWQ